MFVIRETSCGTAASLHRIDGSLSNDGVVHIGKPYRAWTYRLLGKGEGKEL